MCSDFYRYVIAMLVVMLALLLAGFAARAVRGDEPVPAAAPKLVLQTTPQGVVLTTDSFRAWKRLLILPAGENAYTAIAAEHDGQEGGIYLYTVVVTPGGAVAPLVPPTPVNPVNPPPPPPPPTNDLPLDALRAAAAPISQTLPAEERQKLAAVYEALAAQIDAAQIVSPQQLALNTSTLYLATLTQPGRLQAWKPWTTATGTWLDAQQKAGRLGVATMDRYAIAYRAMAEVLRGQSSVVSGPLHKQAEPPAAANNVNRRKGGR